MVAVSCLKYIYKYSANYILDDARIQRDTMELPTHPANFVFDPTALKNPMKQSSKGNHSINHLEQSVDQVHDNPKHYPPSPYQHF